ncbi:hypothetical protein R3P38DRAFT_2674669, partial [Favolaschia claudopus]
MLSQLPPELAEIILSHLDSDWLRATALASSSLLAPSQRWLFRSLVIPYANILKANSLFTVSRHLLGYVHELQVELEASLTAQNHVLAALLPSLHNLTCLSVKGRTAEWNDLTPPLQAAFYDLLSSGRLHSLNLVAVVEIPLSFLILALSSVKKLGIYSVTVEATDSELPSATSALQTEDLTVRAVQQSEIQPLLTFIMQSINVGGVTVECFRRLALGMNRTIKSQSLLLIVATSRSLRYLQLRCGVFQTSLPLPLLPILQELELKFYLGYNVGLPQNLYTAIAALPTTAPSIEVLRLTFHGSLPELEDLVHDRSGPMTLFDGTCAYRECLPRLRKVHCHGWKEVETSSREWTDFRAYIQEKFPGIWDTGMLEVTVGGNEAD